MSVEHVVNLLRIANDNDNLPAVEHRYERFKQEVNSLETRKLNSNKTLQDLKNRLLTLRKALDSCELTYRQQAEKIAYLQSKRIFENQSDC